MGYLDNTAITVDAILTKKGRELLAKGRNLFNITQFALADDEVDYDLWNPAHPLGSDYYGVVIESMPITEAVPDETQSMKYKLITLPKGTTAIPYIQVSNSDITFTADFVGSETISPTTQFRGSGISNAASLNDTLGYTATLLDATYFQLEVATPVASTRNTNSSQVTMNGTEIANSVSLVGKVFKVRPSGNAAKIVNPKSTKLILTGNETGGRVIINLTVTKSSTSE